MYASVNYAIIGSANIFSPDRCQAITWTNADMLLIGALGTYFKETWIKIQQLSFKKICLKMPSR